MTELLVRHFHEKCLHQGRGITTNYIRQTGIGYYVAVVLYPL